jgi:hypothetical protein
LTFGDYNLRGHEVKDEPLAAIFSILKKADFNLEDRGSMYTRNVYVSTRSKSITILNTNIKILTFTGTYNLTTTAVIYIHNGTAG